MLNIITKTWDVMFIFLLSPVRAPFVVLYCCCEELFLFKNFIPELLLFDVSLTWSVVIHESPNLWCSIAEMHTMLNFTSSWCMLTCTLSECNEKIYGCRFTHTCTYTQIYSYTKIIQFIHHTSLVSLIVYQLILY